MKALAVRVMLIANLLASVNSAAPVPNREAIYHRIICVVPVIGSGTARDPKRPMFVQLAAAPGSASLQALRGKAEAAAETRIIAYQSVPTDDGKAAIVMFVAHSYEAFKPILRDPHVIAKFERKDIGERELVRALRKYKKDFGMKQLRTGAL